jgi:hypothetical protein
MLDTNKIKNELYLGAFLALFYGSFFSRCNSAKFRYIHRDNWPLSIKEQITSPLGEVEAVSLMLLSVTDIKIRGPR